MNEFPGDRMSFPVIKETAAKTSVSQVARLEKSVRCHGEGRVCMR